MKNSGITKRNTFHHYHSSILHLLNQRLYASIQQNNQVHPNQTRFQIRHSVYTKHKQSAPSIPYLQPSPNQEFQEDPLTREIRPPLLAYQLMYPFNICGMLYGTSAYCFAEGFSPGIKPSSIRNGGDLADLVVAISFGDRTFGDLPLFF